MTPSLSMWNLVMWHSPPFAFCVEIYFKKCHVTLWLTPTVPHVSFGGNVATPLIIWIRVTAGISRRHLLTNTFNFCYLGSKLRRFQEIVEKFWGFPPVLFFGRGIFQYNYGIVPHRKALTVVIGKPIRVDKIESPSREQVSMSPTIDE